MTDRRLLERSVPASSAHTGTITVEGPVTREEIAGYTMDPGLRAFRPPERQREALMDITEMEEGRIILARLDQTIIGYITFHLPLEFSRWAHGEVPQLIEMGAIEVGAGWRQLGIGHLLMDVAYNRNEMEDYIVIATEYYWHWDLKNSKLDVYDYQKMLARFLGTGGLRRIGTDEPDILAHPANMLMARIGKRVPVDIVMRFEASLYQNRWMF